MHANSKVSFRTWVDLSRNENNIIMQPVLVQRALQGIKVAVDGNFGDISHGVWFMQCVGWEMSHGIGVLHGLGPSYGVGASWGGGGGGLRGNAFVCEGL